MFEIYISLSLILAAIYFYRKKQLNIKQRFSQNLHLDKHIWEYSQKIGFYHCNSCQKMIGNILSMFIGFFCKQCKKCGIITHIFCRSNKQHFKCKQQIYSKDSTFRKHHVILQIQFIDGNLDINSVCNICQLSVGSIASLAGKKCIQCQTIVHNDCVQNLTEICNYGKLRTMIIEPRQIKIQQNSQVRVYSKYLFSFDLQNKDIVLVIINKMSGGQKGNNLLNQFYRLLNPIQVINLIDEGLDKLKIFSNLKNVKILVCGGDGTVGSVINYIKQEIPEFQQDPPSIAILPLGTGNDLSRCLGWGGTFEDQDISQVLKQTQKQSVKVMLDRWNCQITQNDQMIREEKLLNYLGIGLDAKFCLSFHKMRKQFPSLFQSALGNKFIYTNMGTKDIILHKKLNLDHHIKLECDDRQIDLPSLVKNLFQECVVFLNINSWAGGVKNLWPIQFEDECVSDDSYYQSPKKMNPNIQLKNQSFNDSEIEVIGFSSILQMGQCQINMAEPIRICQGKKINIKVDKSNQFMQIDGEPFEVQGPFNIQLECFDKVSMLAKRQEETHKELIIQGKILQALDQCKAQNIINEWQQQQLLEKLSNI